MAIQVDVAILGGGPGGYSAAIRAAQLGKTVAIVEMDKLGGTCLHKGCIPSKSLLHSAEMFVAVKEADKYGIALPDAPTLQFGRVQARKQETVDQLHRGLQFLMKKHGITILKGKGRVIGPSIFSPSSGALAVELDNGEMETVTSKNLIIATGSRPRHLPGLKPDGEFIHSSDEALVLEELPSSMLIVGGGAIGVEWASLLVDFGVAVTLVEAAPRLLPGEDAEISAELEKLLKKRGVRVLTSVELKLDSYLIADGQVQIEAMSNDGAATLVADQMLVSVGRTPNIEGIGLENTDIQVSGGFIAVNEHLQTTERHIYAIGDVIGGVQLAHAAAHEGIAAVAHLAGEATHPVSSERIPRCIYSSPEVAVVGLTEQQAISKGYNVKCAKIPFQAVAKAVVLGKPEGFVKVVSDQSTNDILGVHMIGAHATDLISVASLAQFLDATPGELGEAIYAHPTLSEVLGEAMLAIDGRALSY